jgi:hypothetical protein
VRDSCWSCADSEDRCCVRKDERVERESEMRRSESLSLAILKCDVHWEMSWIMLMECFGGMHMGRDETYGCGIFVEKHFDGLFGIA